MGKLVWSLIAINTIAFLLLFSMPVEMRESLIALLAISSGTSLEIWRWLTSMFVHASASHLFFNMLGLYFFGKVVEEESQKWFIAAYFLSGLIGAFAFTLTSAEFAVGASAAIFGIIGFAMLFDPIRRIHLYVFPLPLGVIAIAFVIFESFVAAFQPMEFAGVGTVAHLGGLVTGAIMMLFYDPTRAAKGALILIVSAVLLILLAPFFSIISTIGGLVMGGLDWLVGLVLYNIAGALGFLWI